MGKGIEISRAALLVPDTLQDPIDVLFDGERVWSFNPDHDGKQAGSRRRVSWPTALRRHLDGTADVELVSHVSGESLFTGQVAFGASADRIRVTDAAGNPLAVDKGGRLQRTFSRTDPSVREDIVDATQRVLRDLTEECGLDAYLAYGCLLGAVRDGHMIGHDSDADLAYLSKFTHPFDIIRECRAAYRIMRGLGWRVMWLSSANFKVWVPLPDGRRCGIDVFGSFHIGDHFHIMGSKRGVLDKSAVLPLSTVTLEGREILAPAKPEEFLEFTYGPQWRVPDPSFHFNHPPGDLKRADAWWRASRRRVRFWQDFYRSPAADKVPTGPSLFAHWVDERIEPGSPLIDAGCGTGRDAVWFANRNHTVSAMDFSGPARGIAKRLAHDAEVKIHLANVNFEDIRSVLLTGALLAHRPEPGHVYARGLLDTLASSGRHNLWRFASMMQRRGGQTFLEFRTTRSRRERMFFGSHPRTFLDPDEVVAEIEEYGGTVEHRVTGRGLAPLEFENPEICRLIVRWTP